MKYLILSNYASQSSPREAADVTTYRVLKTLISKNTKVAIAQINYHDLISKSVVKISEINTLGSFIIERPKLKRNLFLGLPIYYSPQNKCLNEKIDEYAPDVIITVWSEVAQIYIANHYPNSKSISLMGNLDHNIYLANKTASKKDIIRGQYNINIYNSIISKLILRSQLRDLKKIKKIYNPAYNDTQFLHENGISKVSYLPMIWRDESISTLVEKPKSNELVNVLLSVGNIANTSNNLVYKTFLKEIAPHLKNSSMKFRFHIVGGGSFRTKSIKNALEDAGVEVHGFVEDIENFMQSMDVALILNCYTKFVVSHTRFLHCWEQSLPVICLPETKKAMPEIENGFNCLFGNNGRELLNSCLKIKFDKSLRSILKNNGRFTLATYFNEDVLKSALNYEFK